MAKREAITRYHLIINKVRKHPASFKEIKDHLEQQFETEELDLKFSKRTFHRDIEEIATLYNIEISYNQQKRAYEIAYEDDSNSTHQLLEAFDVFNALNIQERLSDYIHFENRKPKGTENIHGILHAIKNHLEIAFLYQSYWKKEPEARRIKPLALKEFKNRWYIVSEDCRDANIKTFGLDRLSELDITRKSFVPSSDFKLEDYYQNCFGIISPVNEKPEEVILSFTPHKGKYIKSLPLHQPQHEIIDNDEEYRIRINVYLTLDLEMEILSHGDEVTVISPKKLADKIRNTLSNSLKKYE